MAQPAPTEPVQSPFHRPRPEALRAAVRPLAWSAVIGAAVLAVATPAQAQPDGAPGGPRVPDSGARPVPTGTVALPGVGGPPPAVAGQLSSLAQQITAAETEVASLGEQLKALNLDRGTARTNLAIADRAWREATERVRQAEQKANSAAADAYKAAAGLPPGLHPDLRDLGALSPVPGDDLPGSGPARDLYNAQLDERAAFQAYSEAVTAEEQLATRGTALQGTFQQKERALRDLKARNAGQLALIEREREAAEQRLGQRFLNNGGFNGFAAHPQALAAVRVALGQLGDPYLWAAEGPDRFDCSGLMWYSYLNGAGFNLPRVSRDQYNGTRHKPVSRFALLPGDLLFFASNPTDWRTIHHVGMYIGNGRMVHAPSTGDVVKVSTVWWSRFFDATRVFGEVSTLPPPPPPNPGQPSTPGRPPGSPSPSPSPNQPSPTPNPPSPTPGSPSPSPSPSSPSPSSPSPSPSQPPDPESPSPSPSPSESPATTQPTESTESAAPSDPPSGASSPPDETDPSAGTSSASQ